MHYVWFLVLGLCTIFTGCLIDYGGSPLENITTIHWNSDGSMVLAIREKPFDSVGYTHYQYYLDAYDRSGKEISSTRIDRESVQPKGYLQPKAITTDGHHIVFSNTNTFTLMFGNITDSALVFVDGSDVDAISPSGQVMLSHSLNIPADGKNITYFLTSFVSGQSRQIRQWKSRLANDQPEPVILTDSIFSIAENISGNDFFSVYDTSLNLIYQEPMPYGGMLGIGYAPSIHSILAVTNWDSPTYLNGNVELIDSVGKSKHVLDWPGSMNAAPDGFHVVFSGTGFTVRNLLTNNEKTITTETGIWQCFSPDAQIVAFVSSSTTASTTVRCVGVNGLP